MATDLERPDLDMQRANNHPTPLVAVWMVTYNHEKYISTAIDSIVHQKTNFPIRLYIGEDCSSDSTRSICIEYANKFPELITLILQETNKGGQRNAQDVYEACFASKAKYIALCEGDDYWTDPLKLQKQVDFLESNTDYAICFHAVKIRDESRNKFHHDFFTPEVTETTSILDLAKKGNYIHTPSVLFRNPGTLPEYFKELPIGDYPLYLFNAQKGKIFKMNAEMAVYRLHNAGYWSTQETTVKQEKAIDYIGRLQATYADDPNLITAFNEQLARLHAHLANSYLSTKNKEKGYKHYLESIHLDPMHVFNEFSKMAVRLKELDRPKTISWVLHKILHRMFRMLGLKVN